MYLSRLILNPRIRRVQKELANPYELHRTLVTQCFAGALDAGRQERPLFRVDVDARTGVPTLLLQSHTRPDWAWLDAPNARGYLLRAPETKPLNLALVEGQTLAFRLRANPTVKRQGKRRGLLRQEEQIDWLRRKGEQGGFSVLSARVAGEARMTGWATRAQKRHKLTMLAVRFDGLLRVTGAEQLRQTVFDGVGSGKGLGFGLLSLAPARP